MVFSVWSSWSRAPISRYVSAQQHTLTRSGSNSEPNRFTLHVQKVINDWEWRLIWKLKKKRKELNVIFLWLVLFEISKNSGKRSNFVFLFHNLSCTLENWLHFFPEHLADPSFIHHILSSKSPKTTQQQYSPWRWYNLAWSVLLHFCGYLVSVSLHPPLCPTWLCTPGFLHSVVS